MDKQILSNLRMDVLPDGSRLHYDDTMQYPSWMEEEQPTEEDDLRNRTLYAALAHAHYVLSMLRAATISFSGSEQPPGLTITGPTLERFALQLALLDAALEVCGVGPGEAIPLPQIEASE